ncbi:hypothetical protein ACWCQZ_47910 [Streptomyces sp. NPDC002285]
MALTLGLSACGGEAGEGVDKASLIEKIKADPETKGAPEATVTCMADAMLKYGDKDSLQGYLDGSVKMDAIKGLGKENKEAKDAGLECMLKGTNG